MSHESSQVGRVVERAIGNRRRVVPGLDRARSDEPGDPRVALGRCADVEVGVERTGHLLGEERAQCATVDAFDDLAEQVPLGVGVVPRLRAWFPPRCLGGEEPHELVVIEEVGLVERLVPAGETRRVRQDVASGDPVLPVGSELGPVAGDRLVQVELTAVGQHQAHQRGHRLGRRHDVDDRVLLPVALDDWHARFVIIGPVEGGRPTPEVHDHSAADRDCDRGSDIAVRGEVLLERGKHPFESGLNGAVNGDFWCGHDRKLHPPSDEHR